MQRWIQPTVLGTGKNKGTNYTMNIIEAKQHNWQHGNHECMTFSCRSHRTVEHNLYLSTYVISFGQNIMNRSFMCSPAYSTYPMRLILK